MVLAGIFAGLGVVVIGFLVLCWKVYWYWVDRMRQVTDRIHHQGRQVSEAFPPIYSQQDECFEQEEAWYRRYHWCLLLAPIFFGLAAFCVVYVLTENLHPWIHVPLTAVSAAGTLLGCGYLGYGVVRERIFRLDDVELEEE